MLSILFNKSVLNKKYCTYKSMYVALNNCDCKFVCKKEHIICDLTKSPQKFNECLCMHKCNVSQPSNVDIYK
jgi:hypothetical protein